MFQAKYYVESLPLLSRSCRCGSDCESTAWRQICLRIEKKKPEKRSAHRCRVEAVDVGPVAQVADCAKGAEQAAAQRSWKNDEAGRQEVEDAQLAGLRQHSGIWASQKQKGVEKQGCLEKSRAGRRPPSSTICQG